MAIRLRRPLALASVVTATLAGVVVLRSVLSGGSDEPLSPVPTATGAPASPTVGATAPVTAALTSTTSPLEKRVFAAGDAVTVKDGIGFLSAADGSLETWSFPGGNDAFYGLQSTPDGALLIFNAGNEGSPTQIIDRGTGKAWTLSRGGGVVAGAGHGSLLVVTAQAAGGGPGYAIANAADGSVRPLAISGSSGAFGLTSPDGRKVALQAGDSIYLVDLASAAVAKLASALDPNTTTLQALPGALGFAFQQVSAAGRRWFGWDGTETPGGLPAGAVSPNGKYMAIGMSPGPIKAFGMGGYPAVSSVSVIDRQPAVPVAQYLGAGLVNSRFGDSAWTSASDGLVIEVSAGYKLVSATGQVQASFDDAIHVLNPRPSPTISGLLGTDRGTIINTARNQTIAPKYAVEPWHAEWTTKPGELAVQLATPGKGRSWPDQLLPFEARTGRVATTPQAVVKTGGDCLQLRERPEASARVVRCLLDGSSAGFTLADDPNPDPKAEGQAKMQYVGYKDSAGTTWLHLSLADGPSGWADAKFLGWAK